MLLRWRAGLTDECLAGRAIPEKPFDAPVVLWFCGEWESDWGWTCCRCRALNGGDGVEDSRSLSYGSIMSGFVNVGDPGDGFVEVLVVGPARWRSKAVSTGMAKQRSEDRWRLSV